MNDTKVTLQSQIELFFGADETISVYRFAKLWSQVRGSAVRPQMCYNYVSQKMLRVDATKSVTKAEALRFLERRASK
jgi:hypothetical protein